MEGVERAEAPVEAKRAFVEIGLWMLFADPVMVTDQLRLEISEDEMDDGEEVLGHFGIPHSTMAW